MYTAAAELPAGADDVSRIAADVQALDLGSGNARAVQGSAHASVADAECNSGANGETSGPNASAQHDERLRAADDRSAEDEAEHDSGSDWTDDQGDEDEDDDWQVAAKSQNSARRQRRKVCHICCHAGCLYWFSCCASADVNGIIAPLCAFPLPLNAVRRADRC
jgi:hypothetical protein